MTKMPLPNILKKASSYILGDGGQDSRPTLYQDGEVLFCKNNVCVHPPTIMRQHCDVVHHPGYLTVTCRFVKNATVPTLHLSWIPNSTLRKHPTTLENNLSKKVDGIVRELDSEYQRQISEESCDSRLDYDSGQGNIDVCLEVKEPINCGDCERICSGGYSKPETRRNENSKIGSNGINSNPGSSGNCKLNVKIDVNNGMENGIQISVDRSEECSTNLNVGNSNKNPINFDDKNNTTSVKSTNQNNPISLNILNNESEGAITVTSVDNSEETDRNTNICLESDAKESEEKKSDKNEDFRSLIKDANSKIQESIQPRAKSIDLTNSTIPKTEFDKKNSDLKLTTNNEIRIWSCDDDSVKSRSMSLTSTCSLSIMAATDGKYICGYFSMHPHQAHIHNIQ